jgi:hypothetical protein
VEEIKMRLKKRGLIPVGIALLVFIAATGVVYGYWTVSGSGTGTASAANGVTNLTVNQTTVLAPMYPGDTAQTISGTFNNPNSAATWVNTVTASISGVSQAVGAVGTCDGTDFTLASPVATVNALIPIGNLQGAWTGPTLQFNNKASNQDGCKGATVHLAYVIG